MRISGFVVPLVLTIGCAVSPQPGFDDTRFGPDAQLGFIHGNYGDGGSDPGPDATAGCDATWCFDGYSPVGPDARPEATALCPDSDNDGWTTCAGDCDDTNPLINPDAFDDVGDTVTLTGQVIDGAGNGIDEDCNGIVDDRRSCIPPSAATGAVDFARALDICENSSGLSTSLIKAELLGTPSADFISMSGYDSDARITEHMGSSAYYLPHWPLVGNGPRRNPNMLILSSGIAADGIDVPTQNNCTNVAGGAWGYVLTGGLLLPQGSCNLPGWPVWDYVDLKLTLHAPANAGAFTFDFSFFSEEWPLFVNKNSKLGFDCKDDIGNPLPCRKATGPSPPHNDHFLALLTSPNHAYDNIVFDKNGKCMCVNDADFEQCTTFAGAPSACSLGAADLAQTSFDVGDMCNGSHGSAGTGWLHTSAPILPGVDFTLELVIFDLSDSLLDSTVIIDRFRWIAQATSPTPVTGR